MTEAKEAGLPIASFYAMYYLAMTKTCRKHGYALTLHGTMQRDCDMVAIPWTEEAADVDILIEDLIREHGLIFDGTIGNKPHGRKAYVFVFWGHQGEGYLDFQVMPKEKKI